MKISNEINISCRIVIIYIYKMANLLIWRYFPRRLTFRTVSGRSHFVRDRRLIAVTRLVATPRSAAQVEFAPSARIVATSQAFAPNGRRHRDECGEYGQPAVGPLARRHWVNRDRRGWAVAGGRAFARDHRHGRQDWPPLKILPIFCS